MHMIVPCGRRDETGHHRLVLHVQTVSDFAAPACFFQQVFDLSQSGRVTIQRHLQAVIELAEIGIAADHRPVMFGFKLPQLLACFEQYRDQQVLKQKNELVQKQIPPVARNMRVNVEAGGGQLMGGPFIGTG